MEKLPLAFYSSEDVCQVARALLGKLLFSCDAAGQQTALRMTEVEAYGGRTDKASHAYGGRRSARTEVMYAAGGCAYVYLCYGLHHLFNVVTGPEGHPDAVLIRAGIPVMGQALMQARRAAARGNNRLVPIDKLCAGPGTLAQAMGIRTNLSGVSLLGPRLWLAADKAATPSSAIRATPRIGIDYAEEDTTRPWRFLLDSKA